MMHQRFRAIFGQIYSLMPWWRYAEAWRIAEHPLLARRKRAPQVLGIDGTAARLRYS